MDGAEETDEEDIGDAEIFLNALHGQSGQSGQGTDINPKEEGYEKELEDANIFAVGINFAIGTEGVFQGACVDSRAQRTVIGLKKAHSYDAMTATKLRLSPTRLNYKFGDVRSAGLGSIVVRVPVERDHVVDVSADVVNVDVPFLLGLDVLTRLKVAIDFGADVASSKVGGW